MVLQDSGTIAVLGSGPAGLMAASRICEAGFRARIYEKRGGPGRKLLVAGSSGLNITYDCPLPELVGQYTGPRDFFERILAEFPPEAWRAFIERELGIATFKGTSRRWFVASEGMKASQLLKAWVDWLKARGVEFELGRECVGFEVGEPGATELEGVLLRFADGGSARVAAACFALGGGSWEPQETPLRWPALFRSKGLGFEEFEASNVGFQVAWPPALLAEAEGKPVKNVVLHSARGERSGDLVITKYGIEGTPVYFAGLSGTVRLDLKPDLSEERIRAKLAMVRENLAPIRRVKRFLNLGEGALALLYHVAPAEVLGDISQLVTWIKKFPLELGAKQPLSEAISSSGGLRWSELDEQLMLRRYAGVFVAGEMLDWDAPTGGFLIQGCVSQGSWAGRAAVRYCSHLAP